MATSVTLLTILSGAIPWVGNALEVEVSVEAAWAGAPLAAELLEGLAEVGYGPGYLRALANGALTSNSSSVWRDTSAKLAEAQLCCGGNSLFARLLSLRARSAVAAARVEAARGLERADRQRMVDSSCLPGRPWAAVLAPAAEALCGAEALEKLAASIADAANHRGNIDLKGSSWALSHSPLDHVLYDATAAGESPMRGLEVVGYADLGEPASFGPLLTALFSVAEALTKGQLPGRVVFRHGIGASGSGGPARLAGYGVELQGRSADEVTKAAEGESKSGDGTEAGDGENAAARGEGKSAEDACVLDSGPKSAADPAALFHGLDLDSLSKRHPEASSALCELRGDLRAAVEAPPPPWELKRLGGHAALRATRIAAGPGGGLAALAALEEQAQDFPSGWARALSAGAARDEAEARDLIEAASELPDAPGLEVNGFRMPATAGYLPLLRAESAILKATELLGQAGFNEVATAPLLRDSRARVALPTKLNTGDPRLATASRSDAVLIYDVLVDKTAESMREEDAQQNAMQGGSQLLRLVRFYGRFWTFPPPLPRPIVGVGLTVDICEPAHLRLVWSLVGPEESPLPAVIWLQIAAAAGKESAMRRKVLALMRKAMSLLDGGEKVRDLLQRFESENKDDDNLCGAKAEERLRSAWVEAWKAWAKAAPALEMEGLDAEGGEDAEDASLPSPTAVVNGRMLVGEAALEQGALERLLKSQVEQVVMNIAQGRIPLDATDQALAAFQYETGSTDASALPPLRVWHPVLTPEQAMPSRYVPLRPAQLQGLPGGPVPSEGGVSKEVPLVAHVLLLGDPSATQAERDDDESGPLAAPAAFLAAYARHLAKAAGAGAVSRWFYVAVAGGCSGSSSATGSPKAPLALSGALRRCLSAGLGNASADWKVLRSIAQAWRDASKAVGEALVDGKTSAAEIVLRSCAATAKSDGGGKLWKAPEQLDLSSAAVAESGDSAVCADHGSVANALGPAPRGGAVLSVNGRRFGPLLPVQSSIAFGAAHVQLVEDLELFYGHRLAGRLARDLGGNADEHLDASSSAAAGALRALRAASPGAEPLQLVYAVAVRASAVEESLAAGGSGDEDEQERKVAKEEQEDENGMTPLESAFSKAPEGLRIHLAAADSLPCPLRIFAVIDPLGKEAQRLPAVLRLLHAELNAEVSIVLRPQQLAAPPLVGYYRAADPAPAPEGGLAGLGAWQGGTPGTVFALSPRRGQLLSVQLHTPEAWLCSAVDSGGFDLDSLLTHGSGTVRARYVLEALFVEGWAEQTVPQRRGIAASGRQLAFSALGLSSGNAGDGTAGKDSVVVKSGYFQLRAPPGLYRLALTQGKEGEQLLHPRSVVELTDLAGLGSQLEVKVGKLSDQSSGIQSDFKDLLPSSSSEPASENSGAAESYEGAGGDAKKCKETVHIFSVASGLRYERLLRIMMLAVRTHTQCPLRFWLVDNFLSPSFRKLLPSLAKRVGFAVSVVTYKWPAWLRAQTQKQRVIWAYKILFLDVLFPKKVRRVLFIDADQIVRANVKELWDVDLKGRVYGFVPFCGSGPQQASGIFNWGSEDLKNPETVGLRFWEQGFWERHLSPDRHYHISALFVVDLVRFRDTGAGDILRSVYQSLTEDPSSLANLDQDLPNYVQRELPIFSLPQEWLWCETWCSEASKERAKTIDMCQNPVRKEGKLQQARRIAPEWSEYDARLDVIIREVEANISMAS